MAPQPGGVGFASVHLPLSDALQQRIAEGGWRRLQVGIRPEFIHVWDEPFDEALVARRIDLEDLGTYKIMTVEVGGSLLKVRLPEDKAVPQDLAYLSFPAQWLMLYGDDYLIEVGP
ncbi:hypothetical protein D9M73_175520 [compost metagenome]